MGGLVTRRYLQIFGEDQVSQVIFIAAPHHGVSGNIERYCGLFGSEAECDDMKRDSLFLKKLELAEVPSIESHNIIGIGCSMGDETGDGIVENSSAYLSWAQNHYIAGTCSDFGFVYLHNDIVDPTQYPEVSVLLADLVS